MRCAPAELTDRAPPPIVAAMERARRWFPIPLVLLALACDREDARAPAAEAAWPEGLFGSAAPAGSEPVAAARAAARPGADVVLRGRIGGRSKPFAEGRAVFQIVDPSLEPCPPDEGCPTPWDYCCMTPEEIAGHSATVEVVGADGAVLARTLRGAHGLEPSREVIVAGKVRSTDAGLVVDATTIHVVGGG